MPKNVLAFALAASMLLGPAITCQSKSHAQYGSSGFQNMEADMWSSLGAAEKKNTQSQRLSSAMPGLGSKKKKGARSRSGQDASKSEDEDDDDESPLVEKSLDELREQVKGSITVFDDDQGSESELDESGETYLDISIVVPHNKQSYSRVFVYPYPPRPPRTESFPQPLPEKEGAIKGQLLTNGYVARSSPDWPYPSEGWRWQHAYHAARRKSHLSLPHSILEHYSWADKMVPYLQKEIIAVNEHEEKRFAAYKKANEIFKDDFTIYKNKAVSRGLEPRELIREQRGGNKMGKHYQSTLPSGRWWVVGIHKCPGLRYYWWHPVDLKPGQDRRVVLNEANAIYIQGGW